MEFEPTVPCSALVLSQIVHQIIYQRLWFIAFDLAYDTVYHTLLTIPNYCTQYLYLSYGSATPVQIIRTHAKTFLSEMNCKAIASQLRTLELIPESVESDILHSKNKEEGNAHLLNHLKEEADEVTVRKVFRVASEKTGYGKMNTFAAFMLNELQWG